MKQTPKPPTAPAAGDVDARPDGVKGIAQLAKTLASDVLSERKRAEERLEAARREIEDGARPKRGRFRL